MSQADASALRLRRFGKKVLPPAGDISRVASVNLLSTSGTGLWLTLSVLYYTHVVGLSVRQVSVGFALATGLGLVGMVPLGRLADRTDVRRLYAALLVAESVFTVLGVWVRSYPEFLVVLVLTGIADRGCSATVGGLIHSVSGGNSRSDNRAYLRSVTNVGVAVGTVVAGIGLSVNTPMAYHVMLWLTGAAFSAAAVLLVHGSRPAPSMVADRPTPFSTPARDGRRGGALKDRRYLVLAMSNSVLSLHFELLPFALPLWISLHTAAPRWTISAALLINTVFVVMTQVRISRRVTTVADARRMVILGALAVAASCGFLVAAHGVAPVVSVLALIGFAVIYTLGVVLHSSSEFYLSFELARDHAQGEYQSIFALWKGLSRAVGPLVLALVLSVHNPLGWAIFGIGTVAAGAGVASAAWYSVRGPGWSIRTASAGGRSGV